MDARPTTARCLICLGDLARCAAWRPIPLFCAWSLTNHAPYPCVIRPLIAATAAGGQAPAWGRLPVGGGGMGARGGVAAQVQRGEQGTRRAARLAACGAALPRRCGGAAVLRKRLQPAGGAVHVSCPLLRLRAHGLPLLNNCILAGPDGSVSRSCTVELAITIWDESRVRAVSTGEAAHRGEPRTRIDCPAG